MDWADTVVWFATHALVGSTHVHGSVCLPTLIIGGDNIEVCLECRDLISNRRTLQHTHELLVYRATCHRTCLQNGCSLRAGSRT